MRLVAGFVPVLLLSCLVSLEAFSLPPSTRQQDSVNPPAMEEPGSSPGVQYGLIIAGLGGEKKYVEQNLDWAAGFYNVMKTDHGFAEERLILLVEDPAATGAIPARKSTLEEIHGALSDLSHRVRPADDLFVLLIGHGSAAGASARLNIPGPDLSADTLRDALGGINGRFTVVVNGASSSAPFIAALSGPGRVIVTATKSGGERLSTVFPEHLLASLKGTEGDLDKNGRVSVLESFIYARNKTTEWYDGEGLLATEHALLDDDGDGRGAREPGDGSTDGALAGAVHFGRVSVPAVATGSPRARSLWARMEELRTKIDELKGEKNRRDPSEYSEQMEGLLIDLARVSRQLRTLEENPP